MVSYYNPIVSEWEPFIEKVKIEWISKHSKGQVFHLLHFKNDLNLNLTTQFMETMINTNK